MIDVFDSSCFLVLYSILLTYAKPKLLLLFISHPNIDFGLLLNSTLFDSFHLLYDLSFILYAFRLVETTLAKYFMALFSSFSEKDFPDFHSREKRTKS